MKVSTNPLVLHLTTDTYNWYRIAICSGYSGDCRPNKYNFFKYQIHFKRRQRPKRRERCCKFWTYSLELFKIHVPLKGAIFFSLSLILKDTSIVFPVVPLSLFLFLAFTIASKSPTDIFIANTCLYMLAFGVAWSQLTIKLIVSSGSVDLEISSKHGPIF